MSFIEKEDQLRLFQVTNFRKRFEQLRQQPEKETRIQPRFQNQLVCGDNVDDPAAAEVRPEKIRQFQGRLAKEAVSAFPFEGYERALYGGQRLCTDQTIMGGNLLPVIRDKPEDSA